LIIELGIQVERVVVTSLRDNTFFAVIEMRMSDGNRMVLDSRPSDAIALALRADCPIYVDEEVIKASQKNVPSEDEGGEDSAVGEEEWPDVIGEAGDLPM
jgi:bifunctional DNase/RNase